MKRKIGRLKVSIVGQMAVKIIPSEPKNSPARIANGMTSAAVGVSTPKPEITISIRAAAPTDFVAPQRISPAMTSSSDRGVATIASKVF